MSRGIDSGRRGAAPYQPKPLPPARPGAKSAANWEDTPGVIPAAAGRPARSDSGFAESARTDHVLARVIERDVIPRLFMASCRAGAEAASQPARAVAAAAACSDSFVDMVLTQPPSRIVDEVERLLAEGVTLSAVYLDVLTPAARQLGVLWMEDRVSFVDVALGVSRLHEVLREVGHRHGWRGPHHRLRQRIHLVAVPGETHTFGLSVVEEFFVHAGWDTSCDPTATLAGTKEVLANQRIDVLGISISCEDRFDALVKMIDGCRQASCNRQLGIMVGGYLLQANPELAGRLRGVALVADAVEALRVAEQFSPIGQYSSALAGR